MWICIFPLLSHLHSPRKVTNLYRLSLSCSISSTSLDAVRKRRFVQCSYRHNSPLSTVHVASRRTRLNETKRPTRCRARFSRNHAKLTGDGSV